MDRPSVSPRFVYWPELAAEERAQAMIRLETVERHASQALDGSCGAGDEPPPEGRGDCLAGTEEGLIDCDIDRDQEAKRERVEDPAHDSNNR